MLLLFIEHGFLGGGGCQLTWQWPARNERFPGTLIKLDIEPGMRLSDLPNQDSFSYHIGTIYLGADSHEELRERYRACLDALHFEFDPLSN